MPCTGGVKKGDIKNTCSRLTLALSYVAVKRFR